MEPLIADHKKMMLKASLESSLDDVQHMVKALQDAKSQIEACKLIKVLLLPCTERCSSAHNGCDLGQTPKPC